MISTAYGRHLLVLVAGAFTIGWAADALAWKPKTHIYLADRVLRDIQNGRIAIHRVNHETGEVLGKVGDYRVDSVLVAAIHANRRIFNAGVLGPDAYPDLITGQCIIHPEVAHDEGSNAWLEHLWNKAKTAGPKEKVFVMGYLFHAAGDMYAHTYMNHYSGGDFAIGANALRHTILEGYIGTKTPTITHKTFSIRMSSSDHTVRDFIYEHMIKAPLGSTLENRLLISSEDSQGSLLSVPRVYSRLRNRLVLEKAELNTVRAGNDLLAGVKRAYIDAWIDDIDEGLRAWPATSEKVAGLLVYNLVDTMSTSEVKEQLRIHCDAYVNQHLLSMSGAPDFVGLTRAQTQAFTDSLLGPISEEIGKLKDDLVDAILLAVTKKTLDQHVDYIKRPEFHFNPILGPNGVTDETATSAASITKAFFDQNELQLETNGEWRLETFPPAYNTVLLTKVALLQKSEVNRLIADLRSPISRTNLVRTSPQIGVNLPTATVPSRTILTPSVPTALATVTMSEDNAMLGFIRKLDGTNQWHTNGAPQQMVFVRAGVYDDIFLAQTGESDAKDPRPEPAPAGDVKVTITHVESIDDVDPAPGQGQADFYARITIDDEFKSFATVEGNSSHSPNWSLTNSVVGTTVKIRILLYDEDTGPAAPDDLCDIDPGNDRKGLDITYNLKTGKITGDVSGDRGVVRTVSGANDSDRCRISFKVEGP